MSLQKLAGRAPESGGHVVPDPDAALICHVGQWRAPDSPVAGHANVLIFPELGAAGGAYQPVERLAGFSAGSAVLHGLAKPCNDPSRGWNPR
ncbi:MAG: phosphate acyltransferase [Gemmatimonadales bacterium]|jgi:phosphate acetyltransferase